MPERQETSTLLVVALLVASWLVIRGRSSWVDHVLLTKYPLHAAYADGSARGRLPLWTPYILGGYPPLTSGKSGALCPPNLISHPLTPTPIALALFLVVHQFWAALGTSVFACRRPLSKSAATGASLLLFLSGFLSTALRQSNLVAYISWLPWLSLFADRVLQSGSSFGRRVDLALSALTSSTAFLTGLCPFDRRRPPFALHSRPSPRAQAI